MVFPRLLIGLLFAALAAPAAAQGLAGPKVQARLVAEQSEIAPGGTTTIALEENIRPGWHTYWRNAGDAGAPTDIQWQLPPGWKVGSIEWPYPKRLPAGPLMTYGYEGKPWLLMPLTAPKTAKPGESVVLKAHANWLVCSETLCVPEDGAFSLPISVSANPSPAYATVAQDFAAARALLPRNSPWTAHYHLDKSLDLFLAAPGLMLRDATFFPLDEGHVQDAAPQKLGRAEGGVVIRLAPSAKRKTLHDLSGVLVLTSTDGSVQALNIAATAGAVPTARFADEMGAVLAFVFAFLGGLILNLMPCVLPVLAIKALALVSKSGDGDAAREGLSYGAGAILSFLVLGLAVVLLRAGGESVGWGFQLQEPRVVAAFALLMFAVGLNLSGVFELPVGISAGDALTRKGGAVGAFFTGVLAVAVAAPCTAPFMAAAVGYALTQGTATALGVFFCLGLGFAAPFVAIGLSPQIQRLLPKPGAWMNALKQFLAFPMYGACAWLVWVVAQEAGQTGLALTLAAIVAFAFAVWAWSASRGARWQLIGSTLAVLGIAGAVAGVLFAQGTAGASAMTADPVATALHGEAYSPQRLEQLRTERRPVFVDATAAWCITCLVNEKVALSRTDVANAFARTHTAYLVADWTNRNTAVTQLLEEHERSGVPLYLYYAPGAADAEVLPQVLTPDAVLAALAKGE